MSFRENRKNGHGRLREDDDLRRWYSNLSKGSIIVADIYLRALGRFCQHVKSSPKEFIKLPRPKMEDLAQDFIDELESARKPSGKPYSPGYIESYLKAIRSWAEWNRKPFQRKIKISNLGRRPTLEDERAPTQEELKRVIYGDKTPLRMRVAIALIAFSGVRIEVLGNYLGIDGLRIKDFPEMEVKDGKVSFVKAPTMIVVRQELSKSRHRYLTFIGEEGCEILKQYLERRISEGESLNPDSGVIATSPLQAMKSKHFNIEDRSPFIRTTRIGDEIRKAMRAVALSWRPYVFRTYFDTALMVAESKGLVSHAYQQFWMGHKGDIEAQYTTNKNRFPESVMEDMREAYRRVQSLLQTSVKSGAGEEDIKASLKKQLLLVAGFKEDEIGKLDLTSMADEDFQRMVREKLLGAMVNHGSRQKPIPVGELDDHLTKGWEFVAALPDERILVRLPF